jgi:hypothetical protein
MEGWIMFTDDELGTIEFCLNRTIETIDCTEFEYETQIFEIMQILEKVRKI